MKLVVLGSGTSVPHAQRTAAAFWLQTGASSILLDVSCDAPHRLAQEGLDWANLSAIWISHFHLDHLGGLAPFLFATKWAPQTQARRQPLTVYGPVGMKQLITAIDESNHYGLFDQQFTVEITEVPGAEEFEILPGLHAGTFSTPHNRESLAIRLEDRWSSLVYTSDTGCSDGLAEFAKAATVLLIECSFRRHKPVQTHLELADVINIARASNPQKLVLTHLYPEWDNFNIEAEARALWPGETIEAVDGLRIEF